MESRLNQYTLGEEIANSITHGIGIVLAARLESINEVRGAIVQRYRLPDGASFTIAQGAASAARTPDGADGEAVTVRGLAGTLYQDDDGARTLLTWSDGLITVWIGGDLLAETAIEIANSLN